MTASTQITWKVLTRLSNSHKWRNAGIFETRHNAREKAAHERAVFGFGNTKIERRVKGDKT